jgi:hypothetical protein
MCVMNVTARLTPDDTRIYRCDVATHRIIVSDRSGRPRFAFGGYGSRPGQFDTPLDLVFVAPEFHGERLPDGAADVLWLAVADYGNRRVQVFDLDGCLVDIIGDDGAERDALGGPCQLIWRSPVLEVEHPDGRRAGVHLAAALLYGSARTCTRRGPASSPVSGSSELRH